MSPVLFAIVAALGLPFGCGACDGEDPPLRDAGASAPRPPLAGPQAATTAAAFDLVPAGGGAVLLFGRPDGVHLLALDEVGAPRGEVRKASDASVAGADHVELAAVSASGRIGVVWIERSGDTTRARATFGDPRGAALSPPIEYGDAIAAPVGRRGSVSISAAPDGAMTVMYRGTVGPCLPGEPRQCTRFYRRALGSNTGQAPRGIETMIVERPCDRLLVGNLWSGDTWFYGACEADPGGEVATVYAIRPSPMYAEPFSGLHQGCEHLGLAALPRSAALLVARCPGDIGAAKIAIEPFNQRPPPVRGLERRVECADTRPVLIARAPGFEERIPLRAPASGLELLLPESIAGTPESRAVWTGEALLVAAATAGPTPRVSLARWVCDGPTLRRDSEP